MVLCFDSSGNTGHKAIQGVRAISRGETFLDGVQQIVKNFTYFWKSVRTIGTAKACTESNSESEKHIFDQTMPMPLVFRLKGPIFQSVL